MRLRSSLLLLAVSSISPLVLFCAYAAWQLLERDTSSLTHTARDRNRAVIATVDARLQSSIDALRALAASLNLRRNDLHAFHADARAVLQSQDGWQNVTLSSLEGMQLVNAGLPWGTPLIRHLVEPASFARAVTTGKPAIGSVSFAPKLQGQPGIAVRLPVEQEGELKYVLTAVLSPALFQRILEEQGMQPGAMTGLAGADGRIIARLPRVPPGTPASNDYVAHTSKSSEGWFRGVTLEGTEMFTSFSTSELTGWSLGYALPSDAVVGGITRAGVVLLMGLAASLGASLVIAAWVGRTISAPIAALARAAEDMPSSIASPLPPTCLIELRQLAKALKESGERLRMRDAQLRESHEALQRQTQDLQCAAVNKSRFLALLAHELRNPMAPLRNGIALLSTAEEPARRTSLLAMMGRQVQTLTRLIEDLVDVSRIDRGQLELRREPLELNELILQAVEIAEPCIDAKRQVLCVRPAGSPIYVNVDGIRLIQVVSNLLNNAAKYTAPGGAISLRVEHQAGMAFIKVSDTGVGFSKEDAERMFGMFVRLNEGRERNEDGLGIGLTIAKEFATQHGGSLEAFSEGVGKGSVFTLAIPVHVGHPTAVPGPELPTAKCISQRRIMIADDNVDAAATSADLLRAEGLEVVCVHDGLEALDVALKQRPQVAFLDLDMPQLSGAEVARHLRRELGPDIVIVALTGLSMEHLTGMGADADFDIVLTKPALPGEMLRVAAGQDPSHSQQGAAGSARV